MKGGNKKKKMREYPKENIPELDPNEAEIEELTRRLEEKRRELNELKREEDESNLPLLPNRPHHEEVKVIEREVTLSLLNDKINYIISILEGRK